jgi:BNR repeat-like domain
MRAMYRIRTLSVVAMLSLCGCGGPPAVSQEEGGGKDVKPVANTDESNAPLTYRRFTVEDKDGKVVRLTPVPDVSDWQQKWIDSEPEGSETAKSAFLPRWARDVSQKKKDWAKGPDPKAPYFKAPIRFVHPPKDEGEPFMPHNHSPAVTWLDNGDLLVAWFSTRKEAGPEVTILASRLRDGADAWDPASEFFKSRNRNMQGGALFNDGKGTLYHFGGVSPDAGASEFKGYNNKALTMRTSKDQAVTWSELRVIRQYSLRNLLMPSVIRTTNGLMILSCESYPNRSANLVVSNDGGKTWSNMSEGVPVPPAGKDGETGKGFAAGCHISPVELAGERIMALGRTGWGKPNRAINGKMPKSVSSDGGKTWTYTESPFPVLASGQRSVLMRLQEGPVLFVSFTGPMSGAREGARYPDDVNVGDTFNWGSLEFTDSNGKKFKGYGMFSALSYDEGETWTDYKLLTPGSGAYKKCGGWTGNYTASPTRAEPGGYLTATQTPDGVIHLISSAWHYRFNLAWLKTPNEAVNNKEK